MHPDQQLRTQHDLPEESNEAGASIQRKQRLCGVRGVTNRLCMLVHSNVYSALTTSLNQWIDDVDQEGYSVDLAVYNGGNAESVRSYLAGLYAEPASLKGAIFVGDIPYVIYEVMQRWPGPDPAEYEDFACDLFFMDLDGIWQDITTNDLVQAGNGKYDAHSGNGELEIWVSRIKVSNLPMLGSEIDIMTNYFEKVHGYQNRQWMVDRRALVYNDDDWSYSGGVDAGNLSRCYGDRSAVTVIDAEITSANDFREQHMTNTFEFIFTRSHGYPGGHGYYTNARTQFEYVYVDDYLNSLPPALFYSFYVCSGSDYTVDNYLAGIAAFNHGQSGLLSWGSTKTGGLWQDVVLYETLSQGFCVGDAFVAWYNDALMWGENYAEMWWYGLVLIGDASLKPAGKDPVLKNITVSNGVLYSAWSSSKGEFYSGQVCTNLIGDVWRSAFTQQLSEYTFSWSITSDVVAIMMRMMKTTTLFSNLLDNSGFELPTSYDGRALYWDWTYPDEDGKIWGNASREKWQSYDGDWEATVQTVWGGTGENFGGWWQQADAQAGNTYRFAGWFWADQTWTAAVQEISLEFYDEGSLLLDAVTNAFHDVGESWVEKEVTGIAPRRKCDGKSGVVNVSGAGSLGALQMDELILQRVP